MSMTTPGKSNSFFIQEYSKAANILVSFPKRNAGGRQREGGIGPGSR